VHRARRAGEEADLVLWLEDCTLPPEEVPEQAGRATWRVATKVDLRPAARGGAIAVSAKTGAGLAALIDKIGMAAAESLGGGNALVTRQRQREAVGDAVAALQGMPGTAEEVAADLLRSASEAIGRLSGRIDVEDVLDRLFSEFCIGK
jgi:tRNA modification GTPase